MKVTVKYNQRGEKRFYEDGVIDERLTARAGLQAGTRGSGVEGIRRILSGGGVEYEESRGQGYTMWVFDEKKLSWRSRAAVLKPLKAFRRSFKRDPDLNMTMR
jgi:hypothetical protein